MRSWALQPLPLRYEPAQSFHSSSQLIVSPPADGLPFSPAVQRSSIAWTQDQPPSHPPPCPFPAHPPPCPLRIPSRSGRLGTPCACHPVAGRSWLVAGRRWLVAGRSWYPGRSYLPCLPHSQNPPGHILECSSPAARQPANLPAVHVRRYLEDFAYGIGSKIRVNVR